MKILLVSDIMWEKSDLKFIEDKIVEIRPLLVLFAGDIISDGSCSRDHISELLELLEFLEDNKIHSFMIQGNHDDDNNYKNLLRAVERLSYAKEISNKVVEFYNIKILGIPFSFTHSLKNVRKIKEIFPEQVDIVLAHSEYVRRIWLFGLKTKIIATGHFDEQLFQILDKVFIASGGFPYEYVIINYDMNELTITHFSTFDKERISTAKLINGNLIWEQNLIRQLQYPDYMHLIENLISAKKKVINLDARQNIIENLLNIGIPKTHIIEYLGREFMEYINEYHTASIINKDRLNVKGMLTCHLCGRQFVPEKFTDYEFELEGYFNEIHCWQCATGEI